MTAASDRRDAPVAAAADIIDVTHHLFLLCEEHHHPGGDIPGTSNGLADTAPDCAFVRTGVHTGTVRLSLELWQQPPPIDRADWDDVVEVSLHASRGRVRVAALDGVGVPTTFPLATPAGPGTYRLRVHARGRDTDIDGTAFEPFEEYLVQVWPAGPATDVVYLATDSYGAELRRVSSRARTGRR